MIELRRVSKTRGKREGTFLTDVTITFPKTGFILLTASDQAVLASTLNMLGGIESPDAGEIFYNGKLLNDSNEFMDSYRRDHVGFIFQSDGFIEDHTVFENIARVYTLRGLRVNKDRIHAMLSDFELSAYTQKKWKHITREERLKIGVKISLARAIAVDRA